MTSSLQRAWFWWLFGQLDNASAIIDGQPIGLQLVWSNGRYYQRVESSADTGGK
ncbi:MAG: hypothetical protein HOV81_14960 [Kofleriaceae bacterium]|nr:hypothetical protein [Kofleriaceae bacterium]